MIIFEFFIVFFGGEGEQYFTIGQFNKQDIKSQKPVVDVDRLNKIQTVCLCIIYLNIFHKKLINVKLNLLIKFACIRKI